MHGRRAAKNLHIEELPLLVTPHPVNDLTPEQVQEMARAAYPFVIKQLTGQEEIEETTKIPYARPIARASGSRAKPETKGEDR